MFIPIVGSAVAAPWCSPAPPAVAASQPDFPVLTSEIAFGRIPYGEAYPNSSRDAARVRYHALADRCLRPPMLSALTLCYCEAGIPAVLRLV